MTILPRVLHPVIVNERISRLRVINNTLQTAFGMQAGGGNVRPSPARRGSYDIFNDTREVAGAVTPGAHAATIARNPVGTVAYTIPRSAEKLPLLMEELNQLRGLGGPVGDIDSLGERYIADQERVVRQRNTNLREFQVAAMLRGSYTFTQNGNAFTHGFSGGGITVDYQMPGGNKSQLDMLGGGDIIGTTWDNASAPIITDLFQINAAFIELVGTGLRDVWCTSVVWGYILANTQVQNQAGSVNQVFEFIERDDSTEDFTARLKAVPWVTFHITDNGLSLGGTFNKLIADTAAVFATTMGPETVSFLECSEPVVDPVSNQQSQKFGEYYYHKFVDDPVSYEFHSRYNGLPVLKIPSAVAYGTVDF